MKERLPPSNAEAEHSVIGSMLLDAESCTAGLELLDSTHFYRPGNAIIFDAIRAMHGKGDAIDTITVSNYLKDDGELEKVGGRAFLSGLVAVVPSVENVEHYGKIVKQHAFRRAAISEGNKLVDRAYRLDSEDEILELASKLPSIQESLEGVIGFDGVDTEGAAESLYRRHRKIKERGYAGIPTGWSQIDKKLLEGLPIGYPAIISGVPGTGKTAFLIQLLDQVAVKNRILLFSLEMPKARVWSRRCASQLYRFGLTDESFNETFIANTGNQIISNPEWKTVVEDETNWHIDERTRLTFPQIIRAIRGFKRKHPDMMIAAIDHLGRVRLTKSGGGRQQEREESVVAMTDLAKELEIIIIWVIQPDTGYLREGKGRPITSGNLDYFTNAGKEAGAMLCLVRPEGGDDVKVYITKGRHGGTGGMVKMRFVTRAVTFEELAFQ